MNWIILDGVNEAFCSQEIRSSVVDWLQKSLPAERITSEPPRHATSDTLTENLMKLAASDWTVIYVPDHEMRAMGRMHPMTDGRAMILMNTRRLSIGKISATREARLLRHEFAHAMGLVAGTDHLMLVEGRHCTNPDCLLFGKVRAIDILAGIFPAAFARRQPDELCGLCRRDLADLRKRF